MTSGERGFYIGSVKWRNQLLALSCLLVFIGFGFFYFQYWVIQKPFGIVLFVVEGLDAQTLAAARIHNGGAEKSLAIDSLPYTAFLKNYTADRKVPEPAAATTALATGTRVQNGAVAVDAAGHPLVNLFDLAQEAGRATGLITDGKLTAPAAASFYGHGQDDADFAPQLIESGTLDVALGRGVADFLPTAQGGRRLDERDLLGAGRDTGYDVVRSLSALEEVPRWRRARILGLFNEEDLALAGEPQSRELQPALSDLVRRGIELLQFHRGGYLLVIDASLMRKARQQGLGERSLAEATELDRAISVAKEYAGEKSAIFVCGDVVTPTPTPTPTPIPTPPRENQSARHSENMIVDYDAVQQWGGAPLASKGVSKDGTREAVSMSPIPSPAPSPAPPTAPAADVLAFAAGLGADALHGTKDSTALFEIIRDNL